MGYTVENAVVPFFADIRDGFPHGGEIELEGDVQGNEKAIWFELKASDGIAMHIAIRMGYSNEHITVVNSHYDGHWQREERHKNHVNHGETLKLSVSNHWNHYEFTINGKSHNFPHRIGAKHINRLEIQGDIRIRRLTFKNMDNHFHVHAQPGAPPMYNPGGGGISVGSGDSGMQPYQSGQPQQPYPAQPHPFSAQPGQPQPGGGPQPYQPYSGHQSPPFPGQPNQPYPPYPGGAQPGMGLGQPSPSGGMTMSIGPTHGGLELGQGSPSLGNPNYPQPPQPGQYGMQYGGGPQPGYGMPPPPGY